MLTENDPRVLLALTVISLGMTTVEKLRELWKAHGVDDHALDAIIAEATQRIARRSSTTDPSA